MLMEQTKEQIAETVWQVAATVHDPELPMLTLADLGVLREVRIVGSPTGGDAVEVILTPTYSGCPATATMRDDLVLALQQAGWSSVTVRLQLAPAWSSDWITELGR